MKIAIACQNRRTVSEHPGKTRVFFVHTAEMGGEPGSVEVLELPKDGMIHGFSHEAHHPLYDMDVLIAKSAGAGFLRRMTAHGVTLALTDIADPEAALRAYLAGDIPPMESVAACAHHHHDHHHAH